MKREHPKVRARRERMDARARARERRRELRAERERGEEVAQLKRSLAALTPEERAALLGTTTSANAPRPPKKRATKKRTTKKRTTKRTKGGR